MKYDNKLKVRLLLNDKYRLYWRVEEDHGSGRSIDTTCSTLEVLCIVFKHIFGKKIK